MRNILICIFLVLSLCQRIEATNYYVSTDGNDSNDGLTPATAWLSIDNGDQTGLLAPGDTVNIYPGNYVPESTVQLKTDGTAILPIVYFGFGAAPSVINGGNQSIDLITIEANHVIIEGLELTNTKGYGMLLKGDSCSILKCCIHDIGKDGIQIEGESALILRNIVANAEEHGLHCHDAAVDARLYGNSIYSSGKNGIEFQGSVTTARVFNNIIASNDKGINSPEAANVCGFNNVWNNSGGDYAENAADSAGGISVAPGFIDPTSDRYDLVKDAAEINAGLDLGYSFTRSAPDIGAKEKYNVYYVSPTGNDANNGLTTGTAWASIDNGDSLLFPGDTVHVLPGTYTDSVIISDSGMVDDPIVYAGFRDSTIIDGSAAACAVLLAGSWVTWSGISVHSASSTNMTVVGNSVIVKYSSFNNSGEHGARTSQATSVVFRHNVFSGNQVQGILIAAQCSEIDIFNCTFYGNNSSGVFDQTGEMSLINGIFESNGASAVRAPTSSQVTYSIFYNNGDLVDGGISLGDSCWIADPLLVEPDSGNFHLGSFSPAIDAGTDVGLSYSSDAPDLGAYEVTGLLVSLTITPSYDSLFADSTYQFLVTALDDEGIPADPGDLTWSHTFPTGDINAAGLFTPELAGSGKIIVISSIDGITDTTEVMDVVPGSLDSLTISLASDTISADSTQQFTANGIDIKGNTVTEMGNLTWEVLGGIGNIDATGLFDAVTAGDGFVKVTSDLGPVFQSDTITVVPGDVSFIETIPAENSVEEGASYQYSANGYDADTNLVADLTGTVAWSTTDPAGSITAGGLYTAGDQVSPPVYYVKAVYGGTLVDSSEVWVATSGALSYIRVELADGTPFGDTTLTTDNDSTILYCRSYNSGDNLLGNISVTWSVIGADSIGSVREDQDATTALTLTTTGTGRVVAIYSASIKDTTGLITCVAGQPVQLFVSPDTASISVDSLLQFTTTSLDADSNTCSLGASLTWSIVGSIGSIDANGLFTPDTAGIGYVVASGGGLVDTSGAITVIPGTLNSIVISPDMISLGIGDSAQFTTTGYDAKSNTTDVGDLTWMLLGRTGTLDSTGLFIADQPGTCSLMVISSINGVSDISGVIDVEALYLSTIPIGNHTVHSGDTLSPLLVFRLDNYFDQEKFITSVTIRNDFKGSGIATELLTNVDSVDLYLDTDNDSILTITDSLIATVDAGSDILALSFSAFAIGSGTGCSFFAVADVSRFPCDGDSLDAYLLSATDVLTSDGTVIDGSDTANSLGYCIIDGMVTNQISLVTTGLDSISPGDTLYNVMTINIPRNGYAYDTLEVLSVTNIGTADDSDIDSLLLFADNGDGTWGGYNQETSLGRLVYTGSQWTRSGLAFPITDSTSRFYIAARLSSYPVDGATLALTVAQNGIEMSSGNDGPIDSPPEPVDTIITKSNEIISINTVNVPQVSITPGLCSKPLAGMELTNSYATAVTIDSISLNLFAVDADGATQEQLESQLDSILMYLDGDADYTTFSSYDSLLGATPVINGFATFYTDGLTLTAGGGSLGLSVAACMNLRNSKNGNLINIGLAEPTTIYFSSPVTVDGNFPLKNEFDHSIDAFPAAAVLVNSIDGGTLYGAQTDQLVFDFELPRNGYSSDQLRSIRLTNTGTLHEISALQAVCLYADATGDGFSEDDNFVGEFINNNDHWEVSNLAYALTDSTTRFLVVIDITSGQFEGGSLKFEIPISGVQYWSGTVGPDDAAVSNPEAHLVFPSNRVTAISIPALSRAVAPGSASNVILTYALYNGYVGQAQSLQTVALTNISQSFSGPAIADHELGQVSLNYDSDKDRTFGDDSLIASGYFADSRLQLSGLDVQLPPESLSYFFVTVDIPLDGIDSDSLAVSIASPSDFIFSEPVIINGDMPLVSGGYCIIDGSISDQYDVLQIASRTLSPGDTSVTLFAFRPTINGDQIDILESVTISNLGNATSSDITSLEFWLDMNSDNTWQDTDSLLVTCAYSGGAWNTGMLGLEVTTDARPTLFAVADIAALATPGATFQGSIPLNGCQYASANDGPIDTLLTNVNSHTISNSALRVLNSPLEATYSVGQAIEVRFSATNLLTQTMDSVFGYVVNINNASSVSLDSSIVGPANLTGGESTDFVFYYTAVQPGEVSWQLQAVAPTIPDTSAITQTSNITVQAAPGNVSVHFINTIPTAVTKAQTNIFPLSLKFDHPDTLPTVASMRLDSLIISIEDGFENPLIASEAFSRIALMSGYTILTVIETVPDQSSLSMIFNEPVVISPGEKRTLSLVVDIDTLATASSFVVAFADANAIQLVDDNNSQPVTIDPGTAFPLRTESCRINEPSQEVAVSYTSLLSETVNYDQEDVEILQLNLRHPGLVGSSQIQLTELTLQFLDGSENAFTAGDLFDQIRIVRHQTTIAQVSYSMMDTTLISIQMSSPLTLSAGEQDSIRILGTIKYESPLNHFSMLIPDSTCLVIRDLESGSLLAAVTDTSVLSSGTMFPIVSSKASLKQAAIAPDICALSLLPSSIVGGADSIALVRYTLVYETGESYSSIRVNNALLYVLDSLGKPLDPDRLFDRVGYRLTGASITYQSFVQLRDGGVVINLSDTGILIDPGDSLGLELIADIEADVSFDHFVLYTNIDNTLLLTDATDTTLNPGVSPDLDCGTDFPFVTGVTQIFLPAGRPNIQSQTPVVQLAYPGQNDLSIFDGSFIYESTTLQGDLSISAIRGQTLRRTTDGLLAVAAGQVFDAIHLYLANELVASDTTLADDSITILLESGFVISSGSNLPVVLKCDIHTDVNHGNYVIRFADSSFIELSDKNLLNAVYPIVDGQDFPLMTTEISLSAADLEHSFTNYPNPFNPARGEETTIGYVLAQDAHIDIEMFSITGEAVKQITMNAFREAGSYQQDSWAGMNEIGRNVVPGTYFCRITARYTSGRVESFKRKIAVVR